MHVYECAGVHIGYVSLPHSTFLDLGLLTESEAHSFSQTSWPVGELQEFACLPNQPLSNPVRRAPAVPGFSHGCYGSEPSSPKLSQQALYWLNHLSNTEEAALGDASSSRKPPELPGTVLTIPQWDRGDCCLHPCVQSLC